MLIPVRFHGSMAADQCCEPDPPEVHGLQEDVDAAGHLVACSQASAPSAPATKHQVVI